MAFENVALTEKGSIEKSISLSKLPNGNYKVTAKDNKPGGKNEQIEMEFTQKGLNALVGTWMVHAEV